MNFRKLALLAVLLAMALFSPGASMPAFAQAQTDAEAVDALEPYLGGYPPSVGSEQEMAKVSAMYGAALARLNLALKAKPNDMPLRLLRGRLQAMGHNMDAPGAYEQADADLQAVVQAEPRNEAALLELARLYVNSSPEHAPRAEALFNRAQAVHGAPPLEEAQRGLFFAYYYQRQIDKALRQAEFLVATWPKVEMYGEMRKMVLDVKSRDTKKN